MSISPEGRKKKPFAYRRKLQKEIVLCLIVLAAAAGMAGVSIYRQQSYRQAAAVSRVPSISEADIMKATNGLAEVDPERQVITFTLKKAVPDAINFAVNLKPGEVLEAQGQNAYIGGDEKNYFIINPYVSGEDYKVSVTNAGGTTSYDLEFNNPYTKAAIPLDISNQDIIAAANGQVYVDEKNKRITFTVQSMKDSAANFMIDLHTGEQISTDSKYAYISGANRNYYVMKPPVAGEDYSITISNPSGQQVYEIVVQR